MIPVGTEHLRSDEWKGKGRVPGAKLKPDLVWLRRDAGDWRKVVVDVKVTSTDDSNKAFKEKDEKYHEWATSETREKKVAKAGWCPSSSPTTRRSIETPSNCRWTSHPTSRLTGSEWPRMFSATST